MLIDLSGVEFGELDTIMQKSPCVYGGF